MKKTLSKNRFYLIETLCLVLLIGGLITWGQQNSSTQAVSVLQSGNFDPDRILKKTTVQKVSGSVDDLDNIINDQMDAFFGKSAQELYDNMSRYDAVRTAKQNALGIYVPDQLEGNVSQVISDVANLRSQLAEDTFFSSASSLSAMNAKYVNDQTREIVDQFTNLNNSLTDLNTKMKDIVKTMDSIGSKLPKLAIK